MSDDSRYEAALRILADTIAEYLAENTDDGDADASAVRYAMQRVMTSDLRDREPDLYPGAGDIGGPYSAAVLDDMDQLIAEASAAREAGGS